MSARLTDPRLPWLLFGIGLAGAAALIWSMQSQLGFAYDEWDFLLGRGGSGVSVLLEPHHEHIAIAHVAVYRSLLEAFGMDSPRPFQVVSLLMFCGSAALVFVYLRRRVGAWLSLAALLPLLVFGPATENVIWPFQLAFSGSMIAGLAALLALERGDRTGDLFACVLVVVSLSFSSLGLAFAVGVAVHVLTGADRASRWWVAVVPIGLFGLWWLGWGSDAESSRSLKNALTAPSYVIDGLAASLASLLGLSRRTASTTESWRSTPGGRCWRSPPASPAGACYRLGRVPREFWVALAILVSFWILAALNSNLLRPPTSERYQLIGAVFILLVASELVRGMRLSRAAVICVFVVAALAAASNLEALRSNWISFRGETELQRGAISAVELLRDRVDPESVIADGERVIMFGNAGLYLSTADEYGSPAYAPEQLAARSGAGARGRRRLHRAHPRARADPRPGPGPRGRPRAGGAARGAGGRGARARLRQPALRARRRRCGRAAPGDALIEGGQSGVDVAARRYGPDFALELGRVSRRHAARLELPPDGATRAWELRLSGFSSATVCAAGSEASG